MDLLRIIVIIFCVLVLTWFLLWIRYAGKVKVVGRSPEVFGFLKGRSLWYFPHYRIGLIPAVNSQLALTINREKKYRPKRELLTGVDGGEFALDWFTLNGESDSDIKENLPENTPILIIEHGMSGGSNERYVQRIGLRVHRELGWRSACVIFRGCCGTRITTPKVYHGGHTEDFHIALQAIRERFPNAPFFLISYSLGANVMIKYLGEQFSRTHQRVCPAQVVSKAGIIPGILGAVAVGSPYDLGYAVAHYSAAEQTLMGKVLLKFLMKHRDVIDADPRFKNAVSEFYENHDYRVSHFDDVFTSRLHGYKDGKDYYSDASCNQYMDGVNVPLLCISARNDPVSLYGAFPTKEIESNPHIGGLVTPGGAHLGFFSFNSTRRTFDEECAIAFFRYKLAENCSHSHQENKKLN